MIKVTTHTAISLLVLFKHLTNSYSESSKQMSDPRVSCQRSWLRRSNWQLDDHSRLQILRIPDLDRKSVWCYIPKLLKKPPLPDLPHAEYTAVAASHILYQEVISNNGVLTVLEILNVHNP